MRENRARFRSAGIIRADCRNLGANFNRCRHYCLTELRKRTPRTPAGGARLAGRVLGQDCSLIFKSRRHRCFASTLVEPVLAADADRRSNRPGIPSARHRILESGRRRMPKMASGIRS